MLLCEVRVKMAYTTEQKQDWTMATHTAVRILEWNLKPKELCHETYRILTVGTSTKLSAWNVEKTAQNMTRKYEERSNKYKRRQGWTHLKKIYNKLQLWFFLKLVSLTVSQSLFSLFVTFDIMPNKQMCWTISCDFVKGASATTTATATRTAKK